MAMTPTPTPTPNVTASPASVDSVEDELGALLENQADFSAWASVITECEKNLPNDVQRIRLVYDALLKEFPLCYGYWIKYATHIAHFSTLEDAENVYERAVQAAAYSVHLWVSYCSFGILAYEDPADVRRLFERGLSFVGKDYLCHLLWDKYIEFEYSQKQWRRIALIYINTLRFPTKKLNNYYDSFKNLVAVWGEEMECQNNTTRSKETISSCEMADIKVCEYAEVSKLIDDLFDEHDGLPRAIALKRYLSVGEKLYYKSSQIDRKISYYEACIRRPYFHVKPLDDGQLENWHGYLDFVESQGDFDWTVKLYERCLIPCANYSEFWIRYVEFVEVKGGREIANYALERALRVFLKSVPAFRLYCSMFKEKIGDIIGARASLGCGLDLSPDFIENVNREANMEKRMRNTGAAFMVYEKAIEMVKRKQKLEILSDLYANFARLKFMVTGSMDAAIEVFVQGIQQTPCISLMKGLINFLTLHGGAEQIPKLETIVGNTIELESDVYQALSPYDREEISKLFLEFVDLYGSIHEIRRVWDRHIKLFPHIMRPACHSNSTQYTSSKDIEGRKQMLAQSPHNACQSNGHKLQFVHLTDNQSLKGNAVVSSSIACNLQQKDVNDAIGREPIEVVEKHSAQEKREQLVEVNESCTVAQLPNATLEYSKIGNQVKSSPDRKSGDDLALQALDSIPNNSPDVETPKSNPTTLECNAPQEATSQENETRHLDEGNSTEVSAVHVSTVIHMRSDAPSQANLQRENSPLNSTCESTPPESEASPKLQMQVEGQTDLQQAVPVNGSYPQNANSGGNWGQVYYVQPSQSPHWHVNAQMQYPATETNSQVHVAQGYSYQSQVWPNILDQQFNQTLGQHQVSAAQVYPTSFIAWPGQNMQQALAYMQAQPSTQTTQPQTQISQYALQGNEQYGYLQNSQGFPPHIWQYYQQYYLQQQQNQQIDNPQQQVRAGQLQQMNPQEQQQMQPQSQQSLYQLQQQNQQQPTHDEQHQNHLSPQPNQNQQHPSQFQQQNQQVYSAQQQYLLYLQQQQLYVQYQHHQQCLQQQQLLQQQQQQQLLQLQQQQQDQPHQVQLLQQQHQQQLLQLQQQQEQSQQQLLMQQQQQLFQLQLHPKQEEPLQQHTPQQQQQPSALEVKDLSSKHHLQQSLPAQQNSGVQNGQQAIMPQGEGPKLQNLQASESSYSSSQPQASQNQ